MKFSSDVSVEKSISVFEQGILLVAHSKKLIEEYEAKITVLKKENGLYKEEAVDGNDE